MQYIEHLIKCFMHVLRKQDENRVRVHSINTLLQFVYQNIQYKSMSTALDILQYWFFVRDLDRNFLDELFLAGYF